MRQAVLARCDQIVQIAVDERSPGARAAAVALECRNQADMRKAELGLAVLSADLKDNVSADPFGLVFDKGQFGVSNMPHNLLAGNEFRYLLGGLVYVLVAICEFGAKPAGIAVELSGPPAANVVDCFENFFGRLVNRE
jgi:hypothetical protein